MVDRNGGNGDEMEMCVNDGTGAGIAGRRMELDESMGQNFQ